MENRKLPRPNPQIAESEALDSARTALETIPIEIQFYLPQYDLVKTDAFVQISWEGKEEKYACEIKNSSTPQAIASAIAQSLRCAAVHEREPLILVPYLSEETLRHLHSQAVSGIDQCGNACLISDHFLIWRSGQPNRYRTPSHHLNPFRGDNSIFSRCFLLRGHFPSLHKLQEYAATRTLAPRISEQQKILTLGTASKTVKALREQLIVTKAEGVISLLDRQKLMTQLKRNYQPPVSRVIAGKIPVSQMDAWDRLRELRDQLVELRFAATGLHSAVRYKALSPSSKLSVYVDDLDKVAEALELKEGKAFANCELIETNKSFPYFDLREEDGVPWAPPIQTWLELANGTAREQEAAKEVERSVHLEGTVVK